MSTILSRVVLPKPDKVAQSALYYHTHGKVRQEPGSLVIDKGSTVRFNSYFNAFFYPKYLRYTHVSEISIHLRISGLAQLRVFCSTGKGNENVLFEDRISDGRIDLPTYKLSELPQGGMIFFELEAMSETARFFQGWYETENTPQNEVKVAAVICTYRREEYVTKNLKQLQQELWADMECPIRDFLDVFVVDNGNTLALEKMAHVQVFPNKNCGGSGGFTRGMIEAHRRKPEYSHVLFMDDDISFETETLVKTVQLLRFAKQFEQPLCIGGQMLVEDEPTVQFEAGAFYTNGKLVPVNQGLNLSGIAELLENEAKRDVQYNAWWYCCIPLAVIDSIGLPLPFFIKTDDVEYGLRMKPLVLLMNGVGVWHTAFSQKYSPHLEYYIKRNELVVSALYDNGAGIWPSLWKLIRASGKAMLIGDPKAISFMLWAYRDFLAGPQFFLGTDGEHLNKQLLQKREKRAKKRLHSILTDPFRVLFMVLQVIINYTKVKKQYKSRIKEITCFKFWSGYLGIELENSTDPVSQ